jgi:hypothetical protein
VVTNERGKLPLQLYLDAPIHLQVLVWEKHSRYTQRLATVTTKLDTFLPYFPVWLRETLVKFRAANIHLMKFSQTHYNHGLNKIADDYA